MKRVLLWVLIGLMGICFAGCGGDGQPLRAEEQVRVSSVLELAEELDDGSPEEVGQACVLLPRWIKSG